MKNNGKTDNRGGHFKFKNSNITMSAFINNFIDHK